MLRKRFGQRGLVLFCKAVRLVYRSSRWQPFEAPGISSSLEVPERKDVEVKGAEVKDASSRARFRKFWGNGFHFQYLKT